MNAILSPSGEMAKETVSVVGGVMTSNRVSRVCWVWGGLAMLLCAPANETSSSVIAPRKRFMDSLLLRGLAAIQCIDSCSCHRSDRAVRSHLTDTTITSVGDEESPVPIYRKV